MHYACHPKGSMILKEGHLPIYFYFILSGQCEVLKDKQIGQPGKFRVNTLVTG
jgi:CRP-like cAMP-binding protein